MATHSSILAWRIPWTEEPGRLRSMGVQESDTTWWLNHHHHHPDITESFFSRELIEFNPPKNQNLCHQYQAWVKLQLALHLLLLTILQFYHLPPPPVSNSSCLFTPCQPLYASCLLYFSRYCTEMKNVSFVSVFVFYVLCEISWVPRLPLLNLQTNWTYEHALGMKLILM